MGRFRNRWAMHFNTIHFIRRMALVLSIILLNSSPILQIGILMESSLLFLIYLINVKPYHTAFANNYDISNEVCIFICLNHLYLFTDFVPKESAKLSIGTSLFVWICLMMSYTVSNLAIKLMQIIINQVKLAYKKAKLIKERTIDLERKKQEN